MRKSSLRKTSLKKSLLKVKNNNCILTSFVWFAWNIHLCFIFCALGKICESNSYYYLSRNFWWMTDNLKKIIFVFCEALSTKTNEKILFYARQSGIVDFFACHKFETQFCTHETLISISNNFLRSGSFRICYFVELFAS